MTADTTRHLLTEDRQRATMKTRVAQWRSRNVPCACHNCRLLASIRELIDAGKVVHVSGDFGRHSPVAADETTKH